MSRKPSLSAEDEALWRRIVDSVKPLKPRAPTAAPADLDAGRPIANHAPPARRMAPVAVSHPKRAPSAPADRGGEKRVRRGKVDIWGSLDLHGYRQDEARAALGRFLVRAQADGGRVVIVVTGKGRGGETGVLKARTPDWLAAPDLRAIVSGIAPAHPRHGGGGAMYVFLRAIREE
jgi:DNA-nicking Smr family endonuclease